MRMSTNGWISLLWSLGLVTPACYADRPIYVAMSPSTPGTAGTIGGPPGGGGSGSGSAGTTGVAGTTGIAGTTGAAGTTGVGGSGIVPPGCADLGQIIEAHYCTVEGACHDRNGAAANFSLTLPFTDFYGWQKKLVGQYPKSGGVIASMCGAANRPYLVPGSAPATGLLLDKLKSARPPCGDQMPSIGDRLTAVELDCVQRWANQLTSNVPPRPCVDVACAGECVGTCGGDWVCDQTALCSGVVTSFCGCDGKTFTGSTCAQKEYAHKGPCEPAVTCAATCGPGTYCRYNYGSPDGGAETTGVFACWPLPASCNGVPSCSCLQVLGCYSCRQEGDHISCAGGV